MVDPEKQISHWRSGAEEDRAVAEDLIRLGRVRHRLFFAHLALEKALKAHIFRTTGDLPPRVHQLLRLADRVNLPMSDEQRVFLARFDRHHLEGRYPESLLVTLSTDAARQELQAAKEVLVWLIRAVAPRSWTGSEAF
jgi:HEPN domain-containing protein